MPELFDDTEKMMRKILDSSFNEMKEKNRQRGDCWRGVGLKGSFLEIRSMFFRLRNLAWRIDPPVDPKLLKIYKKELYNVLMDLRNFTILAEMAVVEENWEGDEFFDTEL